jgi:hypothetical protein
LIATRLALIERCFYNSFLARLVVGHAFVGLHVVGDLLLLVLGIDLEEKIKVSGYGENLLRSPPQPENLNEKKKLSSRHEIFSIFNVAFILRQKEFSFASRGNYVSENSNH